MAGSNRDLSDIHRIRSIWQGRDAKDIWQFYCPLCKVARRIPCRPRPGAKHFLQIGLTAAVFALVTWPIFGWKGIVSFVPFWIVFEVLYRARVRAALSCGNCGFDPYLFLIDVNRAKEEVSSHWRKKFEEKGIEFPEPPR